MMLNFFFYFFDTSIIRGGDIWAYDVSIGKEKKQKQKQKKTRRCQLSYKALGHNFFLYSLFEPALDRLPSASFSKTKNKKYNKYT